MGLAALLKQIRVFLGMTQVEMAQALHLSFSTINRWEKGRARPNRLASVTLLALIKEKGISPTGVDELETALFDRQPHRKEGSTDEE